MRRITLWAIVLALAGVSAPQRSAAQAAGPYEALADALEAIVGQINDEALELEFERELRRLAPLLERDICGQEEGAIVFADMYTDAGQSARRLRGLIHSPGRCPAEAFGNLSNEMADSVFATLPAEYRPDHEHSFGLWVTCPGQTIRTWQTIIWPAWVQLADAEDPSCSELALTRYLIRATMRGLGPDLSVVEYVVTDADSGTVLATFEERIPMELQLGERRYRSVALPSWAGRWSTAEWRRFVLRQTAPTQ